jgi:hypothetical protein
MGNETAAAAATQQLSPEMKEMFGEVIYAYTRADAIDDGTLVDMTEWASSEKGFIGGFSCPVAITRSVFADLENIPPSKRGYQDVRGRAHDMLWMASLVCRSSRARGKPEILFQMILHVGRKSKKILKMVVGAGDDGEQVITIMQRHED